MPAGAQILLLGRVHPKKLALALGFVAACLAGCHRSTPAEAGVKGGVFLFANDDDVPDLDPGTNVDTGADRILSALFEGLVIQSADGSQVLPGAADRWSISRDGLTYTFHLRSDGRWSNGDPVTSADFLFAFRRVFDPLLACEGSSSGFVIVGAQDRAEGRNSDPASLGLAAPDPQTFIIRLRHPSAYFLTILAQPSPFVPVHRGLVERFGGTGRRGSPWTRAGNMISNGRYELTAWVSEQPVVLRPNPYYWNKGTGGFAELRIYPVEDPAIQERGFRAGQYHATANFPVFKAVAYAGSDQSLSIVKTNEVYFLTFNAALPPYNDPRVRRALSLALDRTRIIKAVFGSMADPADSLVRAGIGGFSPHSPAGYPFAPEKARAELAAAGFGGGRGFPAVPLMVVGTNAQATRFAEAIQSAWKAELGVGTEIRPTENKVYLDAERTKHYSVIIDHWMASWNDPTAVYQTAETGNPNNDAGWSNAVFDRIYHDSETNVDPGARAQDFDRLETILAEEVPYAPLYFDNRGHLIHPAVRGWANNPNGTINWNNLSLAR